MSVFRRVATGDTAVMEKAYGPLKGSVNGEMGDAHERRLFENNPIGHNEPL